MNDWQDVAVTFVAGLGLGTMFFVGLWITVKKALKSSMPSTWILGSFFFRIALVMLGLYYIGLGNWQKILVCVAGFILARVVVTHFTKPKKADILEARKEITHEP